MFGLGPTELVVILIIILVLFGGSRVAGLGHGIGKGIREFKKGLSGDAEKTDSGSENSAKDEKKS